MSFWSKKISLPRSPDEFEALVDRVCKKYKLTVRDHATAVIARAIQHIDNYTNVTTLEYLGGAVLKNIANQIAKNKSDIIQHESQVKFLLDTIRQEPGNQQARDELEKAANDGSPFAKAALDELGPRLDPIPTGTDQSETTH